MWQIRIPGGVHRRTTVLQFANALQSNASTIFGKDDMLAKLGPQDSNKVTVSFHENPIDTVENQVLRYSREYMNALQRISEL